MTTPTKAKAAPATQDKPWRTPPAGPPKEAPAYDDGYSDNLLDRFAMAALQGQLADPNCAVGPGESLESWANQLAKESYVIARAMLRERKKSTPPL